jgi:hypothetical protein
MAIFLMVIPVAAELTHTGPAAQFGARTHDEGLDACTDSDAIGRDDFAATRADTDADDGERRRHDELRQAALPSRGRDCAAHKVATKKEITMQLTMPWWTYSAAAYLVCIVGFMTLLLWGIAG